jgi:RimJ/RimL family protein N-acetyltransferase
MLVGGIESENVLKVLRRNPLRNVVLLKLLHASPEGSIVHQVVHGDGAATLLLLDHQFSPFDRIAYPAAEASAVISSDRPDLTRELLKFFPRGCNLVFKLSSEADRQILAEEFPLDRQTAYLSYTSGGIPLNDAGAEIGLDVAEAPFQMFLPQGHSSEWLAPLIASGRAFTSVVEEGGEAVSACFAFQIDGSVWEIGGVYTLPEQRGRRLAFRVVHATLMELARRGYVPRYQVAEENAASIRLAETLGMRRYLILTHYLSEYSG